MIADLILVLKKGEVVQHGTHDELARQPGFYRQIYDLQSRMEDELQHEISGDGTDGSAGAAGSTPGSNGSGNGKVG